MRPTPWSRGYFARGSLLVGQRSVLNLCCALNALSGSHHWDLLKRSIPARASRAPPPSPFLFCFLGRAGFRHGQLSETAGYLVLASLHLLFCC